jgi:hypothetical protein
MVSFSDVLYGVVLSILNLLKVYKDIAKFCALERLTKNL